jgi:hypothetical protein
MHYSLVVGAAPPGDSGQIQELLERAQGYAVFGREGKRVGALIELTGTGAKQIAIRHDGTFLWRRRVLPITAVANVFPEQRAVLLNVARDSLAGIHAPDAVVEARLEIDESVDSSQEVQRRIARYLSSGEREADQPAMKPRPPSEHVDSVEPGVARHLVFISSSSGYTLAELDGTPPLLGEEIEVPEHPGSFQVIKLGPSPLPNDPRICAYLQYATVEPLGAETAERV